MKIWTPVVINCGYYELNLFRFLAMDCKNMWKISTNSVSYKTCIFDFLSVKIWQMITWIFIYDKIAVDSVWSREPQAVGRSCWRFPSFSLNLRFQFSWLNTITNTRSWNETFAILFGIRFNMIFLIFIRTVRNFHLLTALLSMHINKSET